jgi:hypothetical protein
VKLAREVHQDPQVQVDLLDQLVAQDLKVRLDNKGLTVALDEEEQQELQALVEPLAMLVLLDPLVIVDLLDHLELLDDLVKMVHQAQMGLQDQLDLLDAQEQLDCPDHQDHRDHWVVKEPLVYRVQVDLLDPPDPLGDQVHVEQLAFEESLGKEVSLVPLEQQGLQDQLASLVLLVLLDHKDPGVCLENEVILAQLGPQVQEVLLDQVGSVVRVEKLDSLGQLDQLDHREQQALLVQEVFLVALVLPDLQDPLVQLALKAHEGNQDPKDKLVKPGLLVQVVLKVKEEVLVCLDPQGQLDHKG